jgi:ligand-binding sensor domain-containing protein
MKWFKLFCILGLFVSTSFSQQIGVWKNYTDLRSVTDAVISSNGIWAASTGGAFHYSFQDSSYQVLNQSGNGSLNFGISKLTSITVDNEGKVWMGNEDGYIDVYNPVTKSVNRIIGISNSDYKKKRINNLYVFGDSVFASTSFGLSVISTKTLDFNASTIKFGNFSSNIQVSNSVNKGMVFVGTESGVAKQKQGSTTLESPDSWQTFTSQNGLASNTINKLVVYQDTVIAATNLGFSKFTGETWVPFLPVFNKIKIIDVAASGNTLYILTDSGIFSSLNGVLTTLSANYGYTRIFCNQNSNLFAASKNGLTNININQTIAPDGPLSNNFINMDVDGNGNLWIATGKDNKGVGINKFDGTSWKNFNVNNTSNDRLLTNDYWSIYAAPDNTVYDGSWGSGFTKFLNDKTTNYTALNTGLIGVPKNLQFVVITGVDTDSKGNLWITNFWSNSRQNISMLTPDSTWHNYTNQLNSSAVAARELVIDQNDTKWLTAGLIVGGEEAAASTLLYYFNENGNLYSSDVNGWGSVTLTNDAISILSLAVDRRGELWVGTNEGIFIIGDTRDPKNNISLYVRPLSTQSIKSIKVDALNQKWVGTQNGLYLISADGTQILQNFNTKNSPLLNDAITSIAIDDNKGIVYAGTDYGLSSLTTFSINPKAEFSSLDIYPNPVLLDNGSPVSINIDGLIRDTDIKILSISGKLIKTFTSPGGRRAEWDGKDESGNFVASGIYLIVAYDKDGNNVATAKLAVIHK